MRHTGADYYFMPKVKVMSSDRACEYFDIKDDDFLDGSTRFRPPDFDLHLAQYILDKETVPADILEPLNQWIMNNKMLVVQQINIRK